MNFDLGFAEAMSVKNGGFYRLWNLLENNINGMWAESFKEN